MRLCYPLRANQVLSYSHKILNYRKLTREDKKILISDPKEYYKYIFYHLNLPYPTLSQLYMAKFLSSIAYDKEPKMLQCQRGIGKSLSAQIMTTWLLLRNKDEKIVVVSSASGRAESYVKFCLTLIRTVPLLQHLEPKGDDRTATKKFDVAGRTPDDSPSVAAFGVTGSKTGSRATMIIYDDPEDPNNSDTAGKREKLLAGIRDTANLGVAGVFRELVLCTPQSSQSAYNTMVEEDGFKRLIIPAEYPEDISVYEGDLAPWITRAIERNPNIVGQATDKRNNMAHLMKQKVKGKARYKLHYMLDTTMSDAEKYPLKLADLVVTELEREDAPIQIIYSSEPKDTIRDIKTKGFKGDFLFRPKYTSEDKRRPYEGIAMFVDPSGRGKDETGYAVSAQLNGKIFLLDFGGVKGGYEPDTLEELALKAKEYNVNLVQVESNFGDGSFAELLKPVLNRVHRCKVEDIRATSQKEKRIIDTLEPVMMQHRLIVNRQALVKDEKKEAEYSFTYQLTHITEERGSIPHDDIIDVVEMAVAYWQKSLARDEKDAIENHRIQELEASLKELEEKRARNRTPQRSTSLRFAGF